MTNRPKWRLAAGVALAAVLTVVGLGQSAIAAAAPMPANNSAELNNPSYYESLNYGTCAKTENPGDPYVLGAPPEGTYWTLLVLKAGSEQSNDDWNTMVELPAQGAYVHPSGKNLSHVIYCYKNGGGGGTTTTTTTQPGGPCDDYTPTMVAVNPVTLSPGDTVTITGVGYPGDTITATLSPPPIPLGSAIADGTTGQFSITATIPLGTAPGTYTITVSSTQCPASTTATITVVGTVFSGCGYNDTDRTFEQGQAVVWSLHVPSFSTSDPVALTLQKSGQNFTLYSGPWPAGDQQAVTIPSSAPTGMYWIHQSGKKSNGNGSITKKCPVWVIKATNNVVATSPIPSDGGGIPPQTFIALGAMVIGGYSLVRLAGRRADSQVPVAT